MLVTADHQNDQRYLRAGDLSDRYIFSDSSAGEESI
jgi:hypothetical protein